MKKPHHNKGNKYALKSGRSKTLSLRVTPEVHKYITSGETSAGDKIERFVMNEIKAGKR